MSQSIEEKIADLVNVLKQADPKELCELKRSIRGLQIAVKTAVHKIEVAQLKLKVTKRKTVPENTLVGWDHLINGK